MEKVARHTPYGAPPRPEVIRIISPRVKEKLPIEPSKHENFFPEHESWPSCGGMLTSF